MTLDVLNYFVLSQLTAFLFIFARCGAAVMMMPGIGDAYIPMRLRLLFSLMLSVILTPLLQDKMPPMPDNTLMLGMLLLFEVLVGLFIGMIARVILSALHVAGTIIAYQSSLAVSSIFDPVTGAQTAVISNFLTIVAMVVMFALNIHHLMIASVVHSYDMFVPGQAPLMEDITQFNLKLVSDSFMLGVLLASPHIIFSFVFSLMNGLMARLMPNFQIFFVMMSPQILLAFLLLMAVLPLTIDVFIQFMQDQLSPLVPSQ